MKAAKTEKEAVARELWLLYFNRYLYEHGIINERERNLMVGKIFVKTAFKGTRGEKNRRR